ncbi:hypothetical protein, partial [Staphylococcus epidermidis]
TCMLKYCLQTGILLTILCFILVIVFSLTYWKLLGLV